MSAGSLGEGVFTFSGDDREFQKVALRVEKSAKELADEWRKQAEAIARAVLSAQQLGTALDPAKIDKMKSQVAQLSREAEKLSPALEGSADSAVKFAVKISAISYAAQAVRNVGKAFEEMTTKIALGQAGTQELFEEMAKGIPIIGHIFEGGRAIHEALTGDKAATEVIKQQTAAQEARIEVIDRLAESVRKLKEEQADADRVIGLAFGDKVSGALEKGEAAAAKARAESRARHEQEFKDVDKQKKEIADKIRLSTEFANEGALGRFVGAKIGGGRAQQAPRSVTELQTQFAALEKRSAELRAQIDSSLESDLAKKAGRPAILGIGKLVGEQLVKPFDLAGDALKRYIANFPELEKVAKGMLDEHEASIQALAGNIKQFQTEINALALGKAQGLIPADVFDKLTDKSKWDQVARSIGGIFSQYAPVLETVAKLIDSNLGIGNFASKVTDQLASLVPGKIDSTPKKFQSQFVQVEDLNRRIQAATASGAIGGKTPEQGALDGIRKAAEDSVETQKRAVALLDKIEKKKFAGPIGP